jgi:predicted phage tail protein
MSDQHYKVALGTEELPVDTDPDQLHYPAGRSDIRIIPVVVGAGTVGRIIAGVGLIALSFGVASLAAGAVWAGTLSYGTAQAIGYAATIGIGIGASLALSGVAQLLTPIPQTTKDQGDPRKSFSFSGIQNTTRQGTPVPVIYGETLVGSVVISAGIDIVQVKV